MDEIIEAAARAIAGHMRAYLVNEPLPYDEWAESSKEEYRKLARAAIAAIMPAIGERMAVRAEMWESSLRPGTEARLLGHKEAARDIAHVLRALASTMAAEVGK